MLLLRKLPTARQPMPKKNKNSSGIKSLVQDILHDNPVVLDYMTERAATGEEKYGQELVTFDDRGTFQETFEELADSLNYGAKGMREEVTFDGPVNPAAYDWYHRVTQSAAVLMRQGAEIFQYTEEEEEFYPCALKLEQLDYIDRPMIWAQSFCAQYHGDIVGGDELRPEQIALWFKKCLGGANEG
jgi:hypothetical protein